MTSYPVQIVVPLINTNEPEALLSEVHFTKGQHVEQGDVLFTFETTKSTLEFEAEVKGYVVTLVSNIGDTVIAGDVLCYISDDPDWKPQDPGVEPVKNSIENVPNNLRITEPALSFAQSRNIDLGHLPTDRLITKTVLEGLVRVNEASLQPSQADDFDRSSIFIYGAGGHGKSVAELLISMGDYNIAGFVDDDPGVAKEVLSIPVLGGSEALEKLFSNGIRNVVNAVGGIGNVSVRLKVFERLTSAGFVFPVIKHPTAFVEPSAILKPGCQIFPFAYVGSDVTVGFGSIVNTGAIISHDCILADYVNISPGAILAGGVQVESKALIGMGVTINLYTNIGSSARIGNGSTIISDVPTNGIVRAGSIWANKN